MKLIENGLDSFQKALFRISNLDKQQIDRIEYTLKDIIISFHHSLETIFKYLIEEKNEYLVYENLKEIFEGKTEYKKKNVKMKTVQFMDALNRVIILYDIGVDKLDKNIYFKIDYLNELRNSLTHHQCELQKEEIEHLIAIILPSILKIFGEHINGFKDFMKQENLDSNIKHLYSISHIWRINTIINTLTRFDLAYEQWNNIKADNNKRKNIATSGFFKDTYSKCNVCEEKFFVAQGYIMEDCDIIGVYGKCKLCGFELEKDVATLYYTSYRSRLSLLQYLETNLKEELYSYAYEYGIEEIDEIRECAIRNLESFQKHFNNILYKKISKVLYLIMKDIDVDSTDEAAINIILDSFGDIDSKEKVDICNQILSIKELVRFYEKITGEEFDYESKLDDLRAIKINNEQENLQQLRNIIKRCTCGQILSVYEIWLEKKNSNDEYIDMIMRREDYDKIRDYILSDIKGGDLWGQLAGSSLCEFGTVDYVEAWAGDIECIDRYKENGDAINIIAVFAADISTKLYCDHEYISNGSCTIHVEANIIINKDTDNMKVQELKLLGGIL